MAIRDLDVTNPPSGSGLQPGAGFGAANSTNLQTMLNTFLTNSTSTAYRIVFPIGRFQFSSQVTWPTTSNSFRVTGGGGMVKGLGQMQSHVGACTIIEWTGGGTGPMWLIQNSDGDVWEYLNFDGTLGPDRIAAGTHLDVLIKHNRSGAGNGALYHHYKNCTFFRAERLFYAAGGISGVGTAEFTFSKCLFNCGESDLTQWTSQAYFSDNPQSVNLLFDSNCEFNQCGYCVKLQNTGRVRLMNPTVTICGTILHRTGGSQNINGDSIEFPHIDGGSAAEGRKALYKSDNTITSHGAVVIETPKYGSVDGTSDEFITISSFVSTSLTLEAAMRMRVGDKVAFVRKTDLTNENGGKIETTITARFSDTFYATATAAESLGFTGDIEDNYYACNGEALITCVSSDFVHLRNATFTPEHIWAGRLARLTSSSHDGGRCPKLHGQNIQCDWGVDFNEAGLASLLTLTGTAWWRLENAAQLRGTSEPITVGNFGVFEGGGGGGDTYVMQNTIQVQREYGQSGIEQFTLLDASGDPVSGLSFDDGDVTWAKDGADQGNTTNLPASISGGKYALLITASERTSQQTIILIRDQTSPAAFRPQTIIIDAYGHANARHKLNLNETNVKANMKAIADDADAAIRQSYGAGAMAVVTVGSGSTVTTVVTSSIDPPVLDPQQYQNRALFFLRTTTTPELRGKAVPITASSIGGQFTVSGLQTAPVSGDLAIVV